MADSDEMFEEVRLEDEMDTEEFWQQPEALSDLRKILRASFATSDNDNAVELPTRPVEKTSRGFFGKKSKPVASAPPKRPQVQVDADHEDICYRVESEFGLYETAAKSAVVVRVDTKGS